MQAVKQPVTSSNIGKLRLRRSINPFLASVPISYPPQNTRKPSVFSGGIKWEDWSKMG